MNNDNEKIDQGFVESYPAVKKQFLKSASTFEVCEIR